MFQWYLFVLIFAVGLFANITGQVYTENSYGQREQRYGWLPVLIILVPLIYLAGTRDDMGFGDTSAYRMGFHNLPSSLSGLSGYFTENSKGKGFTVFSVIIKAIIGNRDILYFSIIAAICLICVFYVYKKYSCNFIMAIFLFVASGDYIQWTYNGIRQFLAVIPDICMYRIFIEKEICSCYCGYFVGIYDTCLCFNYAADCIYCAGKNFQQENNSVSVCDVDGDCIYRSVYGYYYQCNGEYTVQRRS